MTRKWHIVIQIAAAFGQTVLPTIPNFPQEWVNVFHALVGWAQMALAIWAHGLTPEGYRIPDAVSAFVEKVEVNAAAMDAKQKLDTPTP